MRLICVRHGQASWKANCDAERPLTTSGVEQLHQMMAANHHDIGTIEVAIVSPYLRAQETFEILSQYLDIKSSQECKLFTPETPVTLALGYLEQVDASCANKTVLLVSHNPLISTLVGTLCEGLGGYEPFDTGTMACVDITYPAAGLGQLLWKV